MDKSAILKKYPEVMDKDGQWIKALDQLYAAETYFERSISDFLPPDIASVLKEVASRETDVTLVCFGGWEKAERVRICFLPPYAESFCEADALEALSLQYPEKFGKLGHKDVLGALLGLGISRQKVGDINGFEDHFQVVVSKDIAPFVVQMLDKVGRMRVSVKVIGLSELETPVIQFEECSGTVSAERLDSIVALAYRLSRQEAKAQIESGLVKVNHRVVLQASRSLSNGDLISCRGLGRFILKAIGNETKKGRIHISLLKYPKK